MLLVKRAFLRLISKLPNENSPEKKKRSLSLRRPYKHLVRSNKIIFQLLSSLNRNSLRCKINRFKYNSSLNRINQESNMSWVVVQPLQEKREKLSEVEESTDLLHPELTTVTLANEIVGNTTQWQGIKALPIWAKIIIS